MTVQPPPADRSAPRLPKKIYSVPRRYDLATLFTVTLAFALLFALLRMLHTPPVAVLAIGVFVGLVGLGQALLFKGSAPRAASVLVGMIVFGVIPLIAWAVEELAFNRGNLSLSDLPGMFTMAACSAPWGALVGYITGVVIGAVFLIADYVRTGARRFKGR